MDEFKRIATEQLIGLVGEEWLNDNKNDITTFTYHNQTTIRIVFCLISMLPSEQQVIESTDSDFQPNGSISFDIDKNTKECKVHKNLLRGI